MAVYTCVSTLVLSSNPQVTELLCNLSRSFVPSILFHMLCVLILVLLFLLCARQILSLVPELVNVFAQVVASPDETSEVKAQVGRAFSHLISLYGQQMQPLLSNLPPAHANALAAFTPKS